MKPFLYGFSVYLKTPSLEFKGNNHWRFEAKFKNTSFFKRNPTVLKDKWEINLKPFNANEAYCTF